MNDLKKDTKLYIVLKMITAAKYFDPIVKKEFVIKLEGCTGHLPVFDNEEDAKKAACDGKYKIFTVTPDLDDV